MSKASRKKRRVIAYIDGFNLYFGLKSKAYERYLWLDLRKLAGSLLKGDQELCFVNYFTARVSGRPGKAKRQTSYLEALESLADLDIQYGKYEEEKRSCPLCKGSYSLQNEKQTDVNIAVQMMRDAFEDRFDTAILISGDSDISPAVRAVRSLFPQKAVICAFPPNRVSNVLRNDATASFVVGRAKLARSQFPNEVIKPNGVRLTRPTTWR